MKPGDLIGDRFELGGVAGAGGMGRVYRARDRASGAEVAVKVVAGGAEHHREQFAEEARLLDRLRHPAIVGHVARGVTEGGELYLAMEWLEGEDLAARLARGPLGVEETLAVAARLLGGLAAAHEHGVIHRDIKPSHVFLEGGDPARARLLDFGIARLRGAAITRTGHVLGTVGYMAPEQVRVERELDARVDVFAVGCVLYECLAGRPAFHGEHPAAVLAKIVDEEPPPLGAIRGDVPAALGALVARAMAKRAADRPADAGALARALAMIDPGAAAGGELRVEGDPTAAVRTLLGRPSPCVGRDRELGVLEACYEECAAESLARAVVVTAPPGAGKSRLLRELLARIARAGGEVRPQLWIARGDPTSAGAPFGMLAQLVRCAAGIADDEPAAARAGKLRACVARLLPAVGAVGSAELLGELAGVPADAPPSAELLAARGDAVLLGEALRRAFVDLVWGACAGGAVVIALEDLHWGDVATVRAIDEALRELSERRLFVIALARPEAHELFPRLWAGRAVTMLDLGALPRRAAERLVRAMLGEAVPAAVVEKVIELAAGNAFYLEELIRAVAEGRDGELPETVLAMADARFEALGPEPRRALRAASVFGEVFWRAGLAELLGAAVAPARLDAMLAELVEQEVIERRAAPRFPAHGEYGFRHGLVREAAYRRLTEGDRALGHRLAGDWLERAGELDASVLAAHFDRGGAPARAVPLYLRACQDAIAGGSFVRAIELAERGVACGAAGAELGRLRLAQTEAHGMRFELVECVRAGSEALLIFPRGSGEWFGAAGVVAMASSLRGDRDRAGGLVMDLMATEPGPGAVRSCMVGGCWTMMLLTYSGLYSAASALHARLEWLAGRLAPGDRAIEAFVAQSRWWAACADDDPWQRLVLAREVVARCDEAGSSGFPIRAYADLGVSLHGVGALEAAEHAFARALERANRTETVHGVTFLRLHLGALLIECGRLAEAEALLAEVHEACRRCGEVFYAGRAHVYRARLLLRRGDLEAAAGEARRAIDHPHARPVRAYANAVLAMALLAQGRGKEALEAARQGKRLFDALGAVYEGDAAIHLVLAEALAAAGPFDEALRSLAVARERLLARAARIEDAALRASFLASVGDHARTLDLAGHPTL